MDPVVRSHPFPASGRCCLTTCAELLRPELTYQFVERPDKDVIWGSPLPESLDGAHRRYQSLTERYIGGSRLKAGR